MTKKLGEKDSYTIVESSILDRKGHGFKGGRYTATSPKKAAIKAARILLNLHKMKPDEFGHTKSVHHVVFRLRQTTRSSDNKEKVFKGKAKKIKPVEFKFGKKVVVKEHEYDVEEVLVEDLAHAIREAKKA